MAVCTYCTYVPLEGPGPRAGLGDPEAGDEEGGDGRGHGGRSGAAVGPRVGPVAPELGGGDAQEGRRARDVHRVARGAVAKEEDEDTCLLLALFLFPLFLPVLGGMVAILELLGTGPMELAVSLYCDLAPVRTSRTAFHHDPTTIVLQPIPPARKLLAEEKLSSQAPPTSVPASPALLPPPLPQINTNWKGLEAHHYYRSRLGALLLLLF